MLSKDFLRGRMMQFSLYDCSAHVIYYSRGCFGFVKILLKVPRIRGKTHLVSFQQQYIKQLLYFLYLYFSREEIACLYYAVLAVHI